MERVIVKHIYIYIYMHLADNNLLSHAQHGFINGHSTCTNLLESLNDWTLTVQDKKSVVVAYVDFSTAFGSVSHKKKLLSKLYLYGIRGNLLLWLEHYFCDRSHQTRVGDSLSSDTSSFKAVVLDQ